MPEQLSLFGGPLAKTATFSPDRVYRYTLTRHWGEVPGKRILWIALNPSTADEKVDDNTIRREIGFSRDWGYDGLVKVNLFAFRATLPRDLVASTDPVGEENDLAIVQSARECDRLVAAWGSHGGFLDRDDAVMNLLERDLGKKAELWCLGLTDPKPPEKRRPRHPLYLSADTKLQLFWRAA